MLADRLSVQKGHHAVSCSHINAYFYWPLSLDARGNAPTFASIMSGLSYFHALHFDPQMQALPFKQITSGASVQCCRCRCRRAWLGRRLAVCRTSVLSVHGGEVFILFQKRVTRIIRMCAARRLAASSCVLSLPSCFLHALDNFKTGAPTCRP